MRDGDMFHSLSFESGQMEKKITTYHKYIWMPSQMIDSYDLGLQPLRFLSFSKSCVHSNIKTRRIHKPCLAANNSILVHRGRPQMDPTSIEYSIWSLGRDKQLVACDQQKDRGGGEIGISQRGCDFSRANGAPKEGDQDGRTRPWQTADADGLCRCWIPITKHLQIMVCGISHV